MSSHFRHGGVKSGKARGILARISFRERMDVASRTGWIVVVGALAMTLAGCLGIGGKADTGAVVVADTGSVPLDAGDQRKLADAQYRALEYGRTGAPVEWRGRKAYGNVVVGSLYRVNDTSCREFTATTTVDGQSQVSHGTACREADGSWKPVT